jgi:hypothetical protein
VEFSDLEFGTFFVKSSKLDGPVFRKLVNNKHGQKKSNPLFYTVKFGSKNIDVNVNCAQPNGKLIYMDITTKVQLAEGIS